ncbi:adenylate cyclase class 2 [Stackebrandtia albiflava]|uniref:Adenylate cyclase class 2 n=1 Tax=Stackebrandtia albiflava TaxID=406432 RepID=A0A562V589_9ACTN|nr:CYTH domain-containing protein [Stackebrandtia albiflava]TWJ12988.1 adenylate cyclase class 2 [Stackebrandtia albiflava]
MPVEYEAKVLEVDPEAITDAVRALGGRLVGEARQRRFVYDIVPGDESRWIRLRDDGTRVTLAVKEIAHDGIDGTTETEIVVDDFDTAAALLRRAGHSPKSYQENDRTSFVLDGVRLDLDRWPGIPPYLEIEGSSTREVVETAARLGFTSEVLTSENTVKVYARYGIDLTTVAELRFPSDA